MTEKVIIVYWLNTDNFFGVMEYDESETVEEQVDEYVKSRVDIVDTSDYFGIVEKLWHK